MDYTLEENTALVERLLASDDWKCRKSQNKGSSIFEGAVGGFDGIYGSFRFVVAVDDSFVQIFAFLPASAKKHLAETAEFITRVNYSLKHGSFQMDWNDGEVLYHICVPAEAVHHDGEVFKIMLGLAPMMLSKHSAQLAAVVTGAKTAAEAFRDCE